MTPADPLLPLIASGPSKARAWPKHERGARVEYHRLSSLLITRHPGDAHVGAYSAPSVLRRLGTDPPAYERIADGVPMMVFLWDLDCAAAHRAQGGSTLAKADDEWWRAAVTRFDSLLLEHPGGYVYRTRGGARIIYRLPSPFVLTEARHETEWKRYYLGALAYLARRFGIVCDPSISDWPRLIRLPHVVRDGVPQRLDTLGNARRIGAFVYETDAEQDLDAARAIAERVNAWRPAIRILAHNEPPVSRVRRTPRVVEPREFDAGEFQTLAEDLGRALRHHSGRHQIHLALAGAVYGRGFPLERGPDLARAICSVTGETDDRPQVWQTTADRFAERPITGFRHLQEHWPDLARIVDAALPANGGARALRDALDAIGTPAEVPAAEAAACVREAITLAPAGLSVIRVTEGAGKTQAAGDEAVARGLAVLTERVKSGERTLFVTSSHDVARVIVAKLRAASVTAEYWQSVLAVKLPDGTPACEYHVPVSALVNGGHSAVATFCDGFGMGRDDRDDPCPKREGCPAYDGSIERIHPVETAVDDGQRIVRRSPRVVVTVHAKLSEGLEWAGDDALVIIDEDPEAVTPHSLTRAEIDRAGSTMEGFAGREAYRAVVLRALAAGLERGELPETDALQTVFARGVEALSSDDGWYQDALQHFGTTDAVAIANIYASRVAYKPKAISDDVTHYVRRGAWAPRPSARERYRVFASGRPNTAFAESSRIHSLVARLFAGVVRSFPDGAKPHGERGVAAVEPHDTDPSRRILRALIASPAVGEACRRYGPTVILDATADLDVLAAVNGAPVPSTEIRVADGAPMLRRILYWSHASRRGVFAGDLIRWDNGLERYIREAVGFIVDRLRGPTPAVALFTWKALADVFRAALRGDTPHDPTASAVLEPLRRRGAMIAIGHYGGTRGRDDWMACDAYLSIGDPRPNLGSTRAIAAALGLSAEHPFVYARATSAEASQTAGRARAPWRAKEAVHVHIGTVAPASWDARAEVAEIPRGPGGEVAVDSIIEAVRVHGSKRLAAAAVGLSADHAVRMLRKAGATVDGKTIPSAQSPASTSTAIYKYDSLLVDASDSAPTFDNQAAIALIRRFGGVPAAAQALGISKSIVYHWRKGTRPMPRDAIASLTAHLESLESREDEVTPADRNAIDQQGAA
jgi:hypothetical protein